MRQLVFVRYLTAANDFFSALVALGIPVGIFAWYTIQEGHTLDPATAFTALAWISQMQWSVNTLPALYNVLALLQPSIERLKGFLDDESSDSAR